MISTGVALPGITGNAGNPSTDSDRVSSTRLFGFDSQKVYSHNVHADMSGLIFQAFGLTVADKITIQMVVGCKEGDLYEDVVIGGKRFVLSHNNTLLFVPWPGRFRALYEGPYLGQFHAFAYPAQPDTMFGLGALIQQSMT